MHVPVKVVALDFCLFFIIKPIFSPAPASSGPVQDGEASAGPLASPFSVAQGDLHPRPDSSTYILGLNSSCEGPVQL